MTTQNFVLTPQQDIAITDKIETSAQKLGEILAAQPAYQNFLIRLKAVQADAEAMRLHKEIQQHQSALTYGLGDFAEHQAAYKRLVTEVNALPVMQAYQQALHEAQALLADVDDLISQAAGVSFAANAKKSCCG